MLGGFGKGALKFVEVQLGAKIWILLRKSIRGVVLRICWHLQSRRVVGLLSTRSTYVGMVHRPQLKKVDGEVGRKEAVREEIGTTYRRKEKGCPYGTISLLLSQAPSELQSNVA